MQELTSARPFGGKKSRRGAVVFVTALLLFALFFAYVDLRLRPVLVVVARHEAEILSERAVNAACQEVFGKVESPFVRASYDDRGRLTLVSSDTAQVNRLRADLSESILAHLQGEGYTTFTVPLGNLTDVELFSGRGPGLSVRFVPVSSAHVEIRDAFSSAGVNQTLFSLTAEVEIGVELVAPFYRDETVLQLSCPLTQMIIAGEVPEVYIGA